MFKSLFIRIIITSIFVLVLVLVWLDDLYIEGIKNDELGNTKGISKIVKTDIFEHQDKEARLKYWSQTFNYQFSLKSADDTSLPEPYLEELVNNNVYIEVISGWTDDDITLYYYFSSCNCLLIMAKNAAQNSVWLSYIQQFFLILFFTLTFFIFRYSNGHKEQVSQLTRIYDLYGKGNFDVRTNINVPPPYATLAKTFNKMAEKIELLLQEQKILVQGVSHDIRTPITRLRFALDMTRNCNSVAAYQARVQDMDEDLDDLDRLIDEWLFYAELSGKPIKIKFQEINLQQITTEIANKISQMYPLIQLEIFSEETSIKGDPRLLSRAIENVIINAFKFTKTIVKITVKTKDSKIFLSIEDDGQGVPEYLHSKILQPFVKQSNNEQTAGFGLGLAIVKNILDKHQAKLDINSSELGGAFFLISFKNKLSISYQIK